MKTIQLTKKGEQRVGLLRAKHLYEAGHMLHSLYGNYFVVATWIEYEDGHVEAQMTQAICRTKVNATIMYFVEAAKLEDDENA